MLASSAGSGFFVSYLLPAEELRGKRKAAVNGSCGDRKQILRSAEGLWQQLHLTHVTERLTTDEIKSTGRERDVNRLFSNT